jgi:small GTP-binding protein
MKILFSLKRASLIKRLNENLLYNRNIFANNLNLQKNPLQTQFTFSTLEKQPLKKNTNNNTALLKDPNEMKNENLFFKNNYRSSKTMIYSNLNIHSPNIQINKKNFSTKLKINKHFQFTDKNKLNLLKTFYNLPKKSFCDTISFGDDLNKLINIIARADMDRIPQKNIRNFCIIAHIDHGKSTLSDRLLEKSGAINKLEKKNSQILDTLKVERERGITVKAQTATMIYKYESENENKEKTEEQYILNLIDTPGHVDFSYEVTRSLRPCQGAILLVDASKGVQAQTLSNHAQAKNLALTILPIINKIDLPTANVDTTLTQMEKSMEFKSEDVLLISAKNGINLDKVFEMILKKIPPPTGDKDKPFR